MIINRKEYEGFLEDMQTARYFRNILLKLRVCFVAGAFIGGLVSVFCKKSLIWAGVGACLIFMGLIGYLSTKSRNQDDIRRFQKIWVVICLALSVFILVVYDGFWGKAGGVFAVMVTGLSAAAMQQASDYTEDMWLLLEVHRMTEEDLE